MSYQGKSVIIKNEEEFEKVKEYLGTKNLFLSFLPQMVETETAIVISAKKGSDFSSGSVGSAEYQRACKINTISFNEFFGI